MELGWGVMLPGGGEFTPFGRWSREGFGGHRLNAGTRWSELNGPGEGRARPGRLTLPRGLRLMVDLFAEQFADAARPPARPARQGRLLNKSGSPGGPARPRTRRVGRWNSKGS